MMNVCRCVCVASVVACLVTFCSEAWAIDVSNASYAAVAYAPSTGNYRYAYNYGSRQGAEQAALRQMTEEDAKIVCWVNRGFCALALGDEPGSYGTGWTFGDDAGNREAMDTALRNCRERTTGARVVLCLVSDGQYIYELKPARTPLIETTLPPPSFTPPLPPIFNPEPSAVFP